MKFADDESRIGFYEREYYTFSNFSAFSVEWKGKIWMTSEHVYQAEKFDDVAIKEEIFQARSAHDSKKIVEKYSDKVRANWSDIKLSVMEEILRAKLIQHPFVMKKLVQAKGKTLIEDSWKDAF